MARIRTVAALAATLVLAGGFLIPSPRPIHAPNETQTASGGVLSLANTAGTEKKHAAPAPGSAPAKELVAERAELEGHYARDYVDADRLLAGKPDAQLGVPREPASLAEQEEEEAAEEIESVELQEGEQ